MLKRLFVIVLLFAVNSAAMAEITTLASAINKAGRQRMLTQRMVKAYCMIGLDVQLEQSWQQLSDAIALFELQLRELRQFAPNEKIKRGLIRVEELWVPFKKTLREPNSRANAAKLLETNDELLAAAHKVVLMLQDESGTSFGRLVNISGRQRMLSQRLAKFYMLRAWGFDGAQIREESERAKNEFKGALQELISAPENNMMIKAALKDAKKQWDLYEHGLERNSEELVPLIVAFTSEKVLVRMNEITGMYESLSAR